jgi:hypothetical protein
MSILGGPAKGRPCWYILAPAMPSGQKRPIGITLLAIAFVWIGCCGALFYPLIAGSGGGLSLWRANAGSMIHSESAIKTGSYVFSSLLYLLYVAYAVIGFGLWKLRKWAHKAVLVVNLAGLVLSLTVLPFFVRPGYMAVAAVTGTAIPFAWFVFYLRRPRVCFAFGAWQSPREDTISSEPPPALSKTGKAWVVAGIAATFLLYIGTLAVATEDGIRSTPFYRIALKNAQGSSCAASMLGTPLTPRWGTSGSWTEGSKEGSANLTIPVRGPREKADLEMLAEKQNGDWKITSLVLVRESRRIQLTPVPASTGCQ